MTLLRAQVQFLLAMSLLLLGCQTQPTIVTEQAGVLSSKREALKIANEKAILFDTRSAFDFNLNRVSGAINIPPGDFITSNDPLDATKRLALWGVNPKTPVVVLGTSLTDSVSLAWELVQAGVEDVETYNILNFQTQVSKSENAKKNQPLWTPSEKFGYVTRAQFLEQVKKASLNNLSDFLSSSHARKKALQSEAAVRALRSRYLLLKNSNEKFLEKSESLIVRDIRDNYQFGSNHLLVKTLSLDVRVDDYDCVFLLDSSAKASERAYVLQKSGARSVFIVK